MLFDSEIDGDGHTVEVPRLTDAVFDKTLVWVADVLRQVAEEDELGIACWQLGDVFDFYPFAFYRWGWILFFDNGEQQLVQLAGGDAAAA